MRWLRRFAIGIGGLAALVLLALAVIWLVADRRAARRFEVGLANVRAAPPADTAAIARGRHLAGPIGKCVYCHGETLSGKVFIDDPGLGRIIAPNLTGGRGGVLAAYDDAHLARAIRHGIGADGRPLMVMPSADYNAMSDEDVAALIAYVRQRPRINHWLPASHLGLMGRVLSVTGALPLYDADRIDHDRRSPAGVSPGATVAYGRYLADVGGCAGCHGPGLSGGKIPGTPPTWPPAANISPAGLVRYDLTSFTTALRRGRRPDGSAIDTVMPWRLTRGMTNQEIEAVWRFLQSVPPKTFGGR